MQQTKPKIKARTVKKIRKKATLPQKGNIEAIFKAVDELHKAGVDLSYLKP